MIRGFNMLRFQRFLFHGTVIVAVPPGQSILDVRFPVDLRIFIVTFVQNKYIFTFRLSIDEFLRIVSFERKNLLTIVG